MKRLVLYILLLVRLVATAQTDSSLFGGVFRVHSKNYTALPVRLPLSLSGGFAEIRSNHFHSGLDIRTGGKEGERIYAPADGYVSRINISAWGGGKVLYITHPDGYRTVYMHLSQFCGEIGRFVHDYQYSHHLFAFDIDLPKDSIRVTKGQLIALSGNTGGSAGPHLHYEIRLAENDQTINPLLFGIPYNDPIAPTIAGIKLYPSDVSTTINGSHNELKIYPKGKNTKISDTIEVSGRFYTGIYTYDQMEPGSSSKNGVFRIELYVDGTLFHRYQVPTFMFEETRAINAIIDYPHYQRSREYYILSRHLRGDRNNFSIALRDNGHIFLRDGKVHRLEYRVSDHKGNISRHSFYVRTLPLPSDDTLSEPSILQGDTEPVTYFKQFRLQRPSFSVGIKPYTVYDNDLLIYRSTPDPAGLSRQHHITLKRHPLPPHQSFDLAITIPESIPSSLLDKLTLVCINGKNVSALSTSRDGDHLRASSRSFGAFAIRLDTVAPTVRPVNFAEGKAIKGSRITVKIADNLTGIVSYSCHINGQWQLAEHDGKSATLNVDASHLRKGRNNVTFRITDAVGNSIEQTWTILKN
ncbi:MAG: M23 family metallopeptidase [Bacteroidales bacterium]|nr:M23 family metallopeptidase [Bacteroidales bacterium]